MEDALTMQMRWNAAEYGDDCQYHKTQSDLGHAVPSELSHGAPGVTLSRQLRRQALVVDGRDGEHGVEKADFRQQEAIVVRPHHRERHHPQYLVRVDDAGRQNGSDADQAQDREPLRRLIRDRSRHGIAGLWSWLAVCRFRILGSRLSRVRCGAKRMARANLCEPPENDQTSSRLFCGCIPR